MQRVFTLLVLLTLACSACREKGEELDYAERQEQKAVKAELLQELNSIFDLASNQPDEADSKLSSLYGQARYRESFVQDKDLLSAYTYTEAAIRVQKMCQLYERSRSTGIDYSAIHKTSVEVGDGYNAPINYLPASDPGLLAQAIHGLLLVQEQLYNNNFVHLVVRSAEKEERVKALITQGIQAVLNKIRSYPTLSGKEKDLEGKTYHTFKYEYSRTDYYANMNADKDYIEQGPSHVRLEFKPNNVLSINSLMGFYLRYNPSADNRKHEFVRQVESATEQDFHYYVGKSMMPEGYYFFGDKYLTLMVRIKKNDVDCMMLQYFEYDADGFRQTEGQRLITLRDEPTEMEAMWMDVGNSRAFVSIVNQNTHYGTYQQLDGYATGAGGTAPLRFGRSN